jgi:hypothetical protein
MTNNTAQQVYAAMLRDEIGPRLRELGFSGSSGVYHLRDDHWWCLVAFQKNYYSRRDWVKCTVNVTRFSKVAWERHRARAGGPAKPNGIMDPETPAGVTLRIGNLLPPAGEDRWWELTPRQPTARVSGDVVAAIRDRAIPWLQGGAIDPFKVLREGADWSRWM